MRQYEHPQIGQPVLPPYFLGLPFSAQSMPALGLPLIPVRIHITFVYFFQASCRADGQHKCRCEGVRPRVANRHSYASAGQAILQIRITVRQAKAAVHQMKILALRILDNAENLREDSHC